MHLLQFISNIISLFGRFISNINVSKQHSKRMLQEYENQFSGHFEPEIIREITEMQFYAHIFVMESFIQLKRRSTNNDEIDNNIIYFIIMILHDTLLDSKQLSVDEINAIVHQPETFKCKNFKEHVLRDVLITMQQRVPDTEKYMNDFEKIQTAQIDSLRQFDLNTSKDDLIQIAKNKGGYTFLMYQHFMQLPFEKEINECLFHFGGLIQMTDDLLDFHKDQSEGIRTFANSSKNYIEIQQIYDQQLQLLKNSIDHLAASPKQKRKFYFYMSIVPAFGHIAIDNLKRLQANKDCLPSIENTSRSEWIIDMEKPKYIFKYIKQLYIDSRYI